MRPRAVALLLLAALCGAQACRRSGDEPPRLSDSRFIEEAPQELFEPAVLGERRPVFRWHFADPRQVGSWSVDHADRGFEILEGAGLRLASTTFFAAISRTVDIDASEIDLLELTASEPFGVGFFLSWAGPGQALSKNRHLEVPFDQLRKEPVARVRFAVGDHPRWRGRITRLQLGFGIPKGRPVILRDLSAYLETRTPERATEALSHAWLVDLSGDVRSALPTPPAHPVERRWKIADGAHLRFACGLAPTAPLARGSALFVVEAVDGDDPPRTLLSRRFETGENEPPAWHPAEVDLGALAGRSVTLRLRAETEEGTDLVPFWAHPEILRPRDRSLPPDVALISIDTLRADHLSLYGYSRPTSPHLDAWAKRHAAVFLHTVAAAPWTLPSHTSMLTGLDALDHGVNHAGPVPPTAELLAERLRRAGWTTLAVTGGIFLHPKYGFAQGFDRFRYWTDTDDDKELASGVEAALELLAEPRDRPRFLFFHTYEVHAPYRPRQPYLEELRGAGPVPGIVIDHPDPSPEDGFRTRNLLTLADPTAPQGHVPLPEGLRELPGELYDSGIAYTDARLAPLLDALQEAGAVIVLTSDHGEMLGEHGVAEHAYLWDENLLVPLVIQTPDGRGAGERVDTQVRSVDIVPTILELLGLPAAEGIDGRSLVPLLDGTDAGPPREAWSYAAKPNYGVSLRLANRMKYLYNNTAWSSVPQREALYDLTTDSGEMSDQAAEASRTERLRRRVLERLASSLPGLRLALHNAGPAPLRGTLHGAAVNERRVKLAAEPCERLTWEATDRASFSVAPESACELVFEEPGGEELTLTVASGDEPGFEIVARFAELTGAVRWVLTDGGWRRLAPGEAGGEAALASVQLEWRGERFPARGGSPEVGDRALAERLRALGYVQ